MMIKTQCKKIRLQNSLNLYLIRQQSQDGPNKLWIRLQHIVQTL